MGDRVFERFNVGKDETLDYYRLLVEALSRHGWTPIVEELSTVVSELHQRAGRGPMVWQKLSG
jgi:hypothetical protein